MVNAIGSVTRWSECYFLLKLYLFYNDYETNYTTYINHACLHRRLRLCGLRVFRFQCLIYLECFNLNAPLTAPFKGKYIAIEYKYLTMVLFDGFTMLESYI